MKTFLLNNDMVAAEGPAGTLLLDYIREQAGLPGTKEACREGECGACTVLVGTLSGESMVRYAACASCLYPVGDAVGRHVVTVEGLGGGGFTLVQRLIVEHSASQCGFCTPGIVLSLTGFCLTSPTLSYQDAVDALDGNLCRCTGYASIRRATKALCDALEGIDKRWEVRLEELVRLGVLPGYFLGVAQRLSAIPVEEPCWSPGAVVVAGGTDLFVQRPEALEEQDLCFISRRDDLDYIKLEDGVLRVGGGVTIEAFRTNPLVARLFPSFESDLLLHSSMILRNRATLAGNMVNASPIGDVTVMLLVLGTRLTVRNREGQEREVPLAVFFKAYKKVDLHCGEIVSEIRVPALPQGVGFHFEKVSNRVILDIAAVNTAMRLGVACDGSIGELAISVGGVAAVPMLLSGLERYVGRKLDQALVSEVADEAASQARPIDDVRGTAAYKRLLFRQLVLAHFGALWEERRRP